MDSLSGGRTKSAKTNFPLGVVVSMLDPWPASPDPDVPVVEVLHQVDEMAEIATEAIEPPDDDHVSLPRRLEEGGEPRAVLTLSGRLVLVDRVVADAGLAQSIPLQVEALGTVRLRYPRVADQHWRLQNDRFCDT